MRKIVTVFFHSVLQCIALQYCFFIYNAIYIIQPTYSNITILKKRKFIVSFFTRLAYNIYSCVLTVQTNISFLASVF